MAGRLIGAPWAADLPWSQGEKQGKRSISAPYGKKRPEKMKDSSRFREYSLRGCAATRLRGYAEEQGGFLRLTGR
jgi:hypothetical protein